MKLKFLKPSSKKYFETKAYSGTVDIETGEIIAYEICNRIYFGHDLKTNVFEKPNTFPCTSKDFMLIEAKKIYEEALKNQEAPEIYINFDDLINEIYYNHLKIGTFNGNLFLKCSNGNFYEAEELYRKKSIEFLVKRQAKKKTNVKFELIKNPCDDLSNEKLMGIEELIEYVGSIE